MMLPTLAQLSADMVPATVAWILGASGTMFLLNQALSFYKEHIREQPTPADTYATKKELHETHGRISRERKEIDAAIARVEAQQKELGAQIDSDLQAIRDQVAGNNEASEQRVERINRRLDDLNTSVSGLPAQVVSLINNAKAI